MSNRYELKLLIDPSDLRTIPAANQRVTVAKPINGQSSPALAWLVFSPLSSNDITWSETYGVYASNTPLQAGALVTKLAEMPSPAQDGAQYALTSNGVFAKPSSGPGIEPGSYVIVNEMSNFPGPMSLGLTQSASVNQQPFANAPVCAAAAAMNERVSMTPSLTVFIWLQSSYGSGTIINGINGPSAKATFGGGVSSITMKYDPATGVFVQES